jgi:type II secretion system protein N
MSILENKLSLVIFYITYAFVLAFFLTYYLFPYDKLISYLLDSREQKAFEVQIANAGPGLSPITFVLQGVSFLGQHRYIGNPLASITRLSIKPSLFSILRMRGVDFGLSAEVYGGKITGRIQNIYESNPLKLELSLKSLNLGLWKAVQSLWGFNLGGNLNGDLDFEGNLQRHDNLGTGKAVIKLTDGMIEGLKGTFIPLHRLEKCTLDMALTLSVNRLKVSQCRLDCSQGRAEIAGLILLSADLAESNLDLMIRLYLNPQARKAVGLPLEKLEMRLKGPLDHPKVELSNPFSCVK